MRTKNHAFFYRALCRVGLLAVALGGVQVATAQDYGWFTTAGGIQVWKGPGPVVTKEPVFRTAGQRLYSGLGTGTVITDRGAVALRNGASVTLGVGRLASSASIVAGTRALVGGPVGLALMLGSAAFQVWVNQENTRIAAGFSDVGKPFELRKDSCDASTCYEYAPTNNGNRIGTQFYPTKSAACAALVEWMNVVNGTSAGVTTVESSTPSCSVKRGTYVGPPHAYVERPTIDAEPWQPASMDDIAPYLSVRPIPPNLVPDLLERGGKLDTVPSGNITGPATGPAVPPVKNVTEVSAPSPSSSTDIQPGNPYGLPSNTPTVTGSTTGSTPTVVNGKPVNQPTSTTKTSTFDSDSNRTTTTTTTVTTPVRVETTSQDTTNITYDQSTATATTNTTTTTTVINNITNNVINTTTDGTDKDPATTEEQADICEKNPDILACSKPELDTPDGEIPKTQKEIKYQEESIWGSGSCPADRIMTLHTGQQMKVWDFQKTCEAVNMGIAPIFLLCSVYSAFLILALGVKDGV